MNTTKPALGVVLVRLDKGVIPVPGKAHDTFTSGTILSVNEKDNPEFVGCIAHFRGFRDDCRLSDNRALIETKDILGYDIEST